MPKGYKHITYEERCQIEVLLKSGKIPSEIARILGRDRKTISRELSRNTGLRGYLHKQAHCKATERRSCASTTARKMTPEVIDKIEYYLRKFQWSPEQISGRLTLENQISVSPERIYQHIWADKKQGGDLYLSLRHKAKKYNKRGSKHAGRGVIPNRVDISERPEIVEDKIRLGDWELDLVIGKHGTGVLLTLVDRKTKYTVIILLPDKTADAVTKALLERFSDMKNLVITMTSDNGKEFAQHEKIARALNASFYFAQPYHSWERGLNEHTNGLIRQYFPKKTSFADVTQEDVDRVQALLNNRPRKSLGFRTPQEVFLSEITQKQNGALHT